MRWIWLGGLGRVGVHIEGHSMFDEFLADGWDQQHHTRCGQRASERLHQVGCFMNETI